MDSSWASAPSSTPQRRVIPAARSRTAVELIRWALDWPAVTETTASLAQLRCHAPLAGSTVDSTRTAWVLSGFATHGGESANSPMSSRGGVKTRQGADALARRRSVNPKIFHPVCQEGLAGLVHHQNGMTLVSQAFG